MKKNDRPAIIRQGGHFLRKPIISSVICAAAKRRNTNINIDCSGDPLEIFTEKDGEVIFKKYSPMGELNDFAGQICETMHKTTNRITAVCDRDSIISIFGAPKKDLVEKRISADLEQIMEARQVYQRKSGDKGLFVVEGADAYTLAIAAPIISEGDVMGCVVFINTDGAPLPGEVENKLACTVAKFLGKQMEN